MVGLLKKAHVNTNSLDDEYEIGEKIGEGHFAVVHQCIHKRSRKEFAAKFIMKQRLATSTLGGQNRGTVLVDIDREANILANLQHENIVKLHEMFYCEDTVVIILDLVTGGELFARVAECEKLSEEEASNFVEQILLGVQHMHSCGIAHLDLKPENIMIEDLASRKIKIIDFGLARVLSPNETFQDMAGTPEFCAPEIINYDAITLATDMWAIGVITYILLTGISPFAGDTQMETFQNILDCVVNYSRDEMKDATDLAKDFIRRLLVKNPRKRSTVDDCLSHPWIRPCNMMQTDTRRGSVIKKQNLDCLRHFVAYPTPPASPSVSRAIKGKQVVQLPSPHELTPDADPTCTTSLNHVNCNSKKSTDNGPNVQRTMLKNGIENHTSNSNESEHAIYSEVGFKSEIQGNPCQATEVEGKTPILVDNPIGRGTAGNWRSNLGNSLIGRLGAALAAATIHSPTTIGESRVEQSIKVSQGNGAEGVPGKPVESKSTSGKRVNQWTNTLHQFHRPRKPVNRIMHLGTVSRAVKEFEITAFNSKDYRSTNEAQTVNIKSSVTSIPLESSIWNSQKIQPTTPRYREPNRLQVGRLQEMFESRTTKQGECTTALRPVNRM
ncbi:unnamed protein product [Dicrocoelium dendriticum]|nr:unnamed protein product [Dicrocoelium dendriticum]